MLATESVTLASENGFMLELLCGQFKPVNKLLVGSIWSQIEASPAVLLYSIPTRLLSQLAGADWVDEKDPNVIAETELLQAAASIEAAAKKLSELQPRRKAVRTLIKTFDSDTDLPPLSSPISHDPSLLSPPSRLQTRA